MVASSNGGPLVWYEPPNWTKHVIAPSGRWSCDAQFVDMDGDGDLDILMPEWYTHDRLEWYENPSPEGDPATDPWKRHAIGSPRAHDIAVGDVVIGGRWYEAPEDILRDPWREYLFADWPEDASVGVADINSDGRLDVVLARSEGPHRISWFEAPPDPKSRMWPEHVVDESVDFAHSLVICDMDNDGHLDIVAAEMHQSSRKRVRVYLNSGNAIEWRQQVVATTGSHKLCVGDMTGNGHLDLVGANWSGSYQPIEMWKNLGRG